MQKQGKVKLGSLLIEKIQNPKKCPRYCGVSTGNLGGAELCSNWSCSHSPVLQELCPRPGLCLSASAANDEGFSTATSNTQGQIRVSEYELTGCECQPLPSKAIAGAGAGDGVSAPCFGFFPGSLQRTCPSLRYLIGTKGLMLPRTIRLWLISPWRTRASREVGELHLCFASLTTTFRCLIVLSASLLPSLAISK